MIDLDDYLHATPPEMADAFGEFANNKLLKMFVEVSKELAGVYKEEFSCSKRDDDHFNIEHANRVLAFKELLEGGE